MRGTYEGLIQKTEREIHGAGAAGRAIEEQGHELARQRYEVEAAWCGGAYPEITEISTGPNAAIEDLLREGRRKREADQRAVAHSAEPEILKAHRALVTAFASSMQAALSELDALAEFERRADRLVGPYGVTVGRAATPFADLPILVADWQRSHVARPAAPAPAPKPRLADRLRALLVGA